MKFRVAQVLVFLKGFLMSFEYCQPYPLQALAPLVQIGEGGGLLMDELGTRPCKTKESS